MPRRAEADGGVCRGFKERLMWEHVEFQTTMDGRRQILRYVAELDADGVQDLPTEDLRRYAFKMATGSGKTWVMAMVDRLGPLPQEASSRSDLSTNFLIVAPT